MFLPSWERLSIRYSGAVMSNRKSEKEDIMILDLYPHLNDEGLKEAEENVERYLELVLKIYERIINDPEAYSAFKALTAIKDSPKMNGEKVE
jgi:hypothetical protein